MLRWTIPTNNSSDTKLAHDTYYSFWSNDQYRSYHFVNLCYIYIITFHFSLSPDMKFAYDVMYIIFLKSFDLNSCQSSSLIYSYRSTLYHEHNQEILRNKKKKKAYKVTYKFRIGITTQNFSKFLKLSYMRKISSFNKFEKLSYIKELDVASPTSIFYQSFIYTTIRLIQCIIFSHHQILSRLKINYQ